MPVKTHSTNPQRFFAETSRGKKRGRLDATGSPWKVGRLLKQRRQV